MTTIFNTKDHESCEKALAYLKLLGISPSDDTVDTIVSLANKMSYPSLLGKAVKCDNHADYLLVKVFFHRAGAPVWPWHKGYKDPDSDIHECPYYGWEDAGFMKHTFKPSSHDIITLDTLINHVMYDKDIEYGDKQTHD